MADKVIKLDPVIGERANEFNKWRYLEAGSAQALLFKLVQVRHYATNEHFVTTKDGKHGCYFKSDIKIKEIKKGE